MVNSITGDSGGQWSEVILNIPSGMHTLDFAYLKDNTASALNDNGEIDNFRIYLAPAATGGRAVFPEGVISLNDGGERPQK